MPPLVLMTELTRLADPDSAIRRLPAGSAVIFRDYGHPRRAEIAKRLAALCRERRIMFLVGGDARLALKVKANGLHLRERDLGRMILPGVRTLMARRLLVTAAAHSARALVATRRKGAAAALLGPVFETASHPGAHALGPVRFAALVRESPLPVHALGGIMPGNAQRLLGSGAAGIAGIGAFGRAL